MKKIFTHPITKRTATIVRRTVIVCAVILAVAVVSTFTIDLGPALKKQAETQGSKFIERPMHIGRLSVHLWSGKFVFDDFVIEGLTPQSRPFLTAKRIAISMPWDSLFHREVLFDTIDMTDWDMYVELTTDGRHNFPKFTRDGPKRKSSWTTTLKYVHAARGQFTFEDHGTPWSVVARNLDVVVAQPAQEYRGHARFSGGTVTFQDYVPFAVALDSTFKIDNGNVVFDRMDLGTDGAKTRMTGLVDLGHWPEQTYQLTSEIDNPTQKAIWFAKDNFTASGTTHFTGTFHMFKDRRPDGSGRTGHELKGTFESALSGVDRFRFGDLHGGVFWNNDKLAVTDATSTLYGGTSRFSYVMEPLDQKGVHATATFDASYRNVDLTAFSQVLDLQGIRLAGRATGRNLLQWPLGGWSQHKGNGEMHADPPAGTTLLTRQIPVQQIKAREARGHEYGPFSAHTPLEPVPVGGDVAYAFDSGFVDVAPSHVATPSTYVEMEGRTAYGDRSRMPFHVTSADWQDSDRIFAGILTAFGEKTSAIEVGGYGTFDGVFLNSFSRPRIEGSFASDDMRAFDVTWGNTKGDVVIENSYAEVKNAVVTKGDSQILADGKFSLGFPRKDKGEEIDARVRVVKRPVAELRHAFELDEYRLDGLLTGEFHVYGAYQRPLGFGTMQIASGTAYGETFDTASSSVRLEPDGVHLDGLELRKGDGRGTGAAFVSWDGTYSFNFSARNVPIESVTAVKNFQMPVSGVIDLTATGSGAFAMPRYDVHGTIRDLFVGDEGIGQVVGDINILGDLMTLRLEAASPRLAISGTGRVALTPQMDTEMSFTVTNTSLDPYVRLFDPALSPYTTAVVSGSVRVVGELADIDHLLVDTTVDQLDLRLFDYALHNATPIRAALDRHSVRISEMRLVGEATQLDVSGVVDLHDQRIAMRANGDANLAVLQGFMSNVRSSGRAVLAASLQGSMKDPAVSGTLTIDNGRIRHFALPHALENINGALRFDSRGVTLDGVTARLGGGPVQFFGRVDKNGYAPGRLDVTMTGQGMRLRFPEGMRSLVDATLLLEGTAQDATLSGEVYVRDAEYTKGFDTSGGLFDFGGTSGGAVPAAAPVGSFQPTLPLRYDVHIYAPSSLQVRNNNARLTATADLQLRGSFDRPLLFGRASIDRGELIFEGKRYAVTRGIIDFNNPTRIEPFLDVEAQTRVRVPGETYIVTVRANGTPDRITPEFTSDPPLPPVEVLSLLFSDIGPGRDVELQQYRTDITPQQELLRERAARALTGAISSQVGRVVEQTFGVDTFQITPTLVDPNQQSSRMDPSARMTIGKRLSDRAYVTYARSLSSSSSDQIIMLEYDQTDRFSWILSRNEDRTYAIEVRVRHVF